MEFTAKTTDKQGYKHNRFAWPRAWRMAFTGKGKRVLPPGFNVWFYSLLLVLILAFPALAAVTGYTVSGAGVSSANGSYVPVTGANATYYSQTQYTNGADYLLYNGSGYWLISQQPSYSGGSSGTNSSSILYYSPQNGASMSLSGWSAGGGGVAPAPTFAAQSSSLPTGTFTASPQTIQAGASTTLTWSTQNATSVTLAAGQGSTQYSSASVALSGSSSVSPSQTTTYEIAATNSAGTVYSDVTVSVLAPSLASVAVSPSSITGSSTAAQNVTLTATLSGPAPSGGATIAWSNTTAGGFTGSIGYTTQLTIPAGSTQASEPAGIGASSTGGSVTFTGAYGGTSQSATVAVGAPAAASSSLPPVLYVSGCAVSSLNGTYKLVGTYYTLNGASSGSGVGLQLYQTNGWLFMSALNYADGSYSFSNNSIYYGNNTYKDPTSAGSAYTSQGSQGPAPVPLVSTSPPAAGGGGVSGSGALMISPGPGASGTMSTGTVTLTGASSSPVVVTLTSTAPTVASVPASVTVPAGATSATFPVTCGSLAVSGFTTVSATLSNGVSTSVIYSVNPGVSGASGTLPDGQSTFTDGTGFASGFPGLNFTAPTLPVLSSLSGAPLPAMPTFTLPGIPALGLPGDLKIGIPGIGSIGIPTGWLSKIVQFAAEAAAVSTGMTGSVLTSGMQYAAMTTNLAVFDAGKAVKTSVDNGTYTLQQINSTQNTNTAALQNTANNNTSVIQGTLQNQTFAIQTTAQATQNTVSSNFTSMLTAGPGGLLTQLFQYLFIPDQATVAQLQQCVQTFLNWGPYQLVTQVQTILSAPKGQLTGAPVLPFAAQAPAMNTSAANLSRPQVLGSRAMQRPHSLPVPSANPGTDLAIPVMGVSAGDTLVQTSSGLTYQPAGVWYNTGQSVPFDFTPMTGSKFWPFFRLLEGASVWIVWILGTLKRLMPRQAF